VLFLAVVVSFVDRLTFEAATPLIAREFGLANGDIGTIAAAFIAGLYPGMILWGRITDLVGSRIGMSVAVTGWSIVEILTTGARSIERFGSYPLAGERPLEPERSYGRIRS
jgi:ACS family hexuronate transporter-like MFS transporter